MVAIKGLRRLGVAAMVITVAFFVVAMPRPVWSQPPQPEPSEATLTGDRVVLGSDSSLILNEGDHLEGSIAVLGGRLVVPRGASVEGDIVVLGGLAQINGVVRGDVSMLGGSVQIGQGGRVEGDLVRLGGALERHPSAVVSGAVVNAAPFALSSQIREQSTHPQFREQIGSGQRSEEQPLRWLELILDPFVALLGVVLITLFSVTVAALAPSNLAQATRELQGYPLLALGVGALTVIAVPLLVVLMAITLCLIPFAFLLVLAYALAILLGWVVAARLIGERVVIALGRSEASLIAQTAVGAVLLAMLGNAPVLGGLISLVSVAFGLGALVLTRLGTQPYTSLQSLSPRAI